MTFHLGTTIGDYEIIDVIENSKTHTTYKVKNKAENRFEALRVLSRGAQDDNDRLERFVREMKVHARLTHPNIVAFYQATQLEGYAVMTTELLDGIALDRKLEATGLPAKETAAVMGQLLSALDCAHQHGIVHRGITPSNIFITPEGAVKLTGFAMAKSSADPQLTQVGAVVGSVWYMSPEQVKGITDPDPSTDIYSAGIILYELLTGKRPFDSQSQFEVMTAHVTTSPKPPSALNPSIPKDLDAIVLTALAKEPQARYASAAAFRTALLGEEPKPAATAPAPVAETPVAQPPAPVPDPVPAAPAPEPVVAAEQPLSPPPPRRNLMQMATAAGLMFVVCIVWYYVLVATNSQ